MSKKTLIIIIAILVAGAGAYNVAGKNRETDNNIVVPTASNNPQDYQQCLQEGGEVAANQPLPRKCVIDGEAYYDGNF